MERLNPVIPVTEVRVTPSSLMLKKGDSYILDVTVLPANATSKSLEWVSSDSSVVSVKNGMLTALENGKAEITCISLGSMKVARCEVEVNKVQPDTPSAWAAEACLKAVDSGLILGDGDGWYGWKEPLTLERMLVIFDKLELLG